jgi:MFS family permease
MPQLWARIGACSQPLRLLLLSEMLGLLAGAVGQVGVAWWIGQRGGAPDLARYGASMAFCSLLAMPLMSPLGDRWAKRRLIRLGKLCLLLDARALALLAASGFLSPAVDVRLCVCSAMSMLGNAVLLPTQASILPELVETERLPEAIRLRRGAQAVGGLLGPGLGGAALALGGIAVAMALNLLMFGVAAIAAFRLGEPRFLPRRSPSSGWFGDLAAGLRAKWGVPLDRWWTVTGALIMMFFLPATGMLLPLRLQSLGLSAFWFGACGVTLSLGLLVGVAGAADLLIARLDRVGAISAALLVCGLAVGGVGLCDWGPCLVLLFGVIGICMSVTQLVGQTHRMLAIPEGAFGRAWRPGSSLSPNWPRHWRRFWPARCCNAGPWRWSICGWRRASYAAACLLAVPDLRPFLRLDP